MGPMTLRNENSINHRHQRCKKFISVSPVAQLMLSGFVSYDIPEQGFQCHSLNIKPRLMFPPEYWLAATAGGGGACFLEKWVCCTMTFCDTYW